MFNVKKRYIIESIIIILILFIFLMTIFFIFNKNSESTSKNSGKENNISISFSDDSTFNVKNILPLSDKLGINLDVDDADSGVLGYSLITLYNDSLEDEQFDLYFTKLSTESDINDNYIKIYLTDDKNVPLDFYSSSSVLTYNKLSVLSDKPDSRLLYNGTISKKSNLKFILRVWVSDSYALSDNLENFKFSVGVKAS